MSFENLRQKIKSHFGEEKLHSSLEILGQLAAQDSAMIDFLQDWLETEVNGKFFESNHFERTLAYKNLLSERTSTLVSRFIAILYPPQPLTGCPQVTGAFLSQNVDQAVSSLHEKGYYLVPFRLSDNLCDQLIAAAADKKFLGARYHDTLSGFSESVMRSAKGSLYRIRNQSEFLSEKVVRDISMDHFILEVAQKYLFSPPIHVQTNFWWTKAQNTPGERELNANAQLFHRDKEYIRFLKIFIYLNDVDSENGPHEFIPGSHVSDASGFGEGQDSFRRFSEIELRNQKQLPAPMAHLGKRGTIIFEDTYGFHRGGTVNSGHRLMFQLEYANSLYFRYSPPFEEKFRLSLSCPRVLSNYTNMNRQRLIAKENKEVFFNKTKAQIRQILGR